MTPHNWDKDKARTTSMPAVAGAWRIENPSLWMKCAAGRQHIADACKQMPAPRTQVQPPFVRATEALHSGNRLYSAVKFFSRSLGRLTQTW
jgi:hypothetical protein